MIAPALLRSRHRIENAIPIVEIDFEKFGAVWKLVCLRGIAFLVPYQ